MVVGICTVELYIGESCSLKDKRRIVRALLDQVRHRFNVAAAEVGSLDNWQRASLGFATVSNDYIHVNQVLAAVVGYIQRAGTAEIIDYGTEII